MSVLQYRLLALSRYAVINRKFGRAWNRTDSASLSTILGETVRKLNFQNSKSQDIVCKADAIDYI